MPLIKHTLHRFCSVCPVPDAFVPVIFIILWSPGSKRHAGSSRWAEGPGAGLSWTGLGAIAGTADMVAADAAGVADEAADAAGVVDEAATEAIAGSGVPTEGAAEGRPGSSTRASSSSVEGRR